MRRCPADFSWRAVRASDGAAPPGRYAAEAVDQHRASWCGCCYMVAAVQCVEDRLHVARARSARAAPGRVRLSLQHVLDHFVELDAEPGWNACHGGFPLHVFECMGRGACPLVEEGGLRGRPVWRGHPRPVDRTPVDAAPRFRVANARRVPPDEVTRELLDRGPIVLEVSAHTLKKVDGRGVATDLTPRAANHAVAVVGWRDVDGEPCWIVRNSWGASRVPRAVPRDVSCVSRDGNDCEVEWEPWSGDPTDPGFALLPCSYAPLRRADGVSPWVAADVHLVGDG